MSEKYSGSELTPEQSADVIKYFHDSENAQYRQNGWRDKISIGQSAIHTTRSRESITLDGIPALTNSEMGKGLNYIIEVPKKPKLTDEMLDAAVDKMNLSYDAARRMFEQEGYDTSDQRELS